MSGATCSACGGIEFLRVCRLLGIGADGRGLVICLPCLAVWYDPPEAIDSTSPAEVGALSLKLKAQGKYPWTGEHAPERSARRHQRQSNPYDPT